MTRVSCRRFFTFNCASAYFYQRLQAPYASPLIGHLFRSWKDYLRFLVDMPALLEAGPIFGEPRLPRYPLAGTDTYPVSFFGDIEIHWIHALRPDQVLHRIEAGMKAMDWSRTVVTFCEANFGPAELTRKEWQWFRWTWEALPYHKVFMSTGHYGRSRGSIGISNWAGFKHFEDVCGVGAFRCKPGCGGCGRPRWGQFTKEAIFAIRWLDLDPPDDPNFRLLSPKAMDAPQPKSRL